MKFFMMLKRKKMMELRKIMMLGLKKMMLEQFSLFFIVIFNAENFLSDFKIFLFTIIWLNS